MGDGGGSTTAGAAATTGRQQHASEGRTTTQNGRDGGLHALSWSSLQMGNSCWFVAKRIMSTTQYSRTAALTHP